MLHFDLEEMSRLAEEFGLLARDLRMLDQDLCDETAAAMGGYYAGGSEPSVFAAFLKLNANNSAACAEITESVMTLGQGVEDTAQSIRQADERSAQLMATVPGTPSRFF